MPSTAGYTYEQLSSFDRRAIVQNRLRIAENELFNIEVEKTLGNDTLDDKDVRKRLADIKAFLDTIPADPTLP